MSQRWIAPRTELESGVTSSTSDPPVDTEDSQPGPSRPRDIPTARQRKKVTVACGGCQKRRVKCDGHRPCETCVRANRECIYQPALDGRSIKRKYHEVQRDQEFLADFINTIRYSENDDVSNLVSIIRSGVSLEEIKACVEHQANELRLAGRERSSQFRQIQNELRAVSSTTQDRPRAVARPDVLEIQRLAYSHLYTAHALPWTTVTSDDDLVSNLLSVWLTWDKGFYDWIDEDLFMRDMMKGSLDAVFCSPFLVNCILAWACPYSNFKEAKTKNGATSQLMTEFIEEAKRLLESETLTGMCLTTVQGLLFLHAALAISGQDQSGHRYVLQAIGMINELISSPFGVKSYPDPQMAQDISGNIDRTCWGVYMITTQTMLAFLRPQTMEIPRRARPGHQLGKFGERSWRAYPFKHEALPFPREELFDFGCDLAILEADLSRILFNMQEQPSRRQLEQKLMDIYASLQQHLLHLPNHLEPTAICCPALYANKAKVETIKLRIFLSLRVPHSDANQGIVEIATSNCVNAALEVSRLCKLYMEAWDVSSLGVMMAQPIFLSLTVLLEEPDTSTYSMQITELCMALRALSKRWPLCLGMLRTIQLDVRMKGWVLPPDTDKLFEDFGHAWRYRETRRFFTLYPVPDSTKTGKLTGDELDMGKFLDAMDMLELEDVTD